MLIHIEDIGGGLESGVGDCVPVRAIVSRVYKRVKAYVLGRVEEFGVVVIVVVVDGIEYLFGACECAIESVDERGSARTGVGELAERARVANLKLMQQEMKLIQKKSNADDSMHFN